MPEESSKLLELARKKFAPRQLSLAEEKLFRAANQISSDAKFDRLEIEDWTRSGFLVHYDNGQTAEVSWSFIRELPPKNSKK